MLYIVYCNLCIAICGCIVYNNVLVCSRVLCTASAGAGACGCLRLCLSGNLRHSTTAMTAPDMRQDL